uniref:Uncharacterized protein n=1 Tax=Anguilla anguilla TaxID=7936 RepID=A0A0E9TEV0_ANGAN
MEGEFIQHQRWMLLWVIQRDSSQKSRTRLTM